MAHSNPNFFTVDRATGNCEPGIAATEGSWGKTPGPGLYLDLRDPPELLDGRVLRGLVYGVSNNRDGGGLRSCSACAPAPNRLQVAVHVPNLPGDPTPGPYFTLSSSPTIEGILSWFSAYKIVVETIRAKSLASVYYQPDQLLCCGPWVFFIDNENRLRRCALDDFCEPIATMVRLKTLELHGLGAPVAAS